MERTMRPYADERLILQTGQGDIAALQRLLSRCMMPYTAMRCPSCVMIGLQNASQKKHSLPYGKTPGIIMWKRTMHFHGS